ncbi:MAG: peptidylprolyl isomerase [Bacteroidales bacterium]|nr:peptidylprolyl isomerase [Bacteroidales bacterium]
MKNLFYFLISLVIAKNTFCQQNYPHIIIETTEGNMELILYDNTPMHSDNFIELVKQGFYDELLFHRTIPEFMIQSGDPNSKNALKGKLLGTGGPDYNIPAEFNPSYYHKRGALAAARQPDRINPNKESSGSQFYIVQGKTFSIQELNAFEAQGLHIPFTDEQKHYYTSVGGTPHLDYAYTVFGELVEGFDVLYRISQKPTDRNNRPLEDVKIIKSYIKEKN